MNEAEYNQYFNDMKSRMSKIRHEIFRSEAITRDDGYDIITNIGMGDCLLLALHLSDRLCPL